MHRISGLNKTNRSWRRSCTRRRRLGFKRLLVAIALCPIANFAFADGSFQEVLTLLKKESKKDQPLLVSQALKKLSEAPAFSPLFKHYTLVKNSFSLQESSALDPRVLLFGETAQLVVTFNARAEAHGGAALEFAEFDASSNRILFREILFKDELPKTNAEEASRGPYRSLAEATLQERFDLSPSEIAYENEKLLVTTANPNKCMRCHTLTQETQPDLARYIWDRYDHWPRVYGELDDRLSNEESDSLKNFKALAQNHDRYKYLQGLRQGAYPYTATDDYFPARHKRPNLLLTDLLAINQAKVLAQLVRSQLSPIQLQQFSNQVRCHPQGQSYFFKQALKRVGFSLETATTLDHPHPPTYDIKAYNLGINTLFGSFTMSSLTRQELFRQLNSDQSDFQELLTRARNTSTSGYDKGLPLKTRQRLKSHFNLTALPTKQILEPLDCQR